MLVTFMRHGVAVDRADPRCPPDFERPLTVEGRNRAGAAIRGLRALGVKPERVLASPYVRCQQTARLAIQGLDLPRRALLTSDLLAPGVDPRGLWAELGGLGVGSVLVVGHGGTLEPIAGVALGLPTVIPGALAPTVDLAWRTLALRKAGALQLEVRFAAAPAGLVEGGPTAWTQADGAEGEAEVSASDAAGVTEARLAWKLPARLLRLIGR
jgi:phosphohistidine phosphatase SixA